MNRTSPAPAATPTPDAESRGLLTGATAYGIWGMLPLYIAATAPASAIEIVIMRIGFSLVFCLILLLILRRFRELRTALGTPRRLGAVGLAALMIAINWLLYASSVTTGHVAQASLGYFMNPLVNVLLGVALLGERLRFAQWAAVAIAAAAVLVITLDAGQVPWIGLGLAFSFGLYGLIKKRAGTTVHPVTAMTAETAVLMPVFVVGLVWLTTAGLLTTGSHGVGHTAVMAASGIITAVPLILFATAARTVPLSVLGILQYIAPTLQFLLAITVFGEHMAPGRWVGFGLIWLALVVFTADHVRHARRQRRLTRLA
ncbi:MAG: EamA family transporter RarD [Micrococcus sp.]|nr:EamA family transporter RarD [Micrococcus sp.]